MVRDIIFVKTMTFDIIYNDPSTWKLRLKGFMSDYDKGSDDDAMWNPKRREIVIDLKSAFDRSGIYRGIKYTLPGDRDSENADLKLQIGGNYLY